MPAIARYGRHGRHGRHDVSQPFSLFKYFGAAAARRAPAGDLLDGDAPVWVLDAVDGTSNFAKGSPDFAVMVALVRRRQTIAGWIFRPVDGDMYTCELGAGSVLW